MFRSRNLLFVIIASLAAYAGCSNGVESGGTSNGGGASSGGGTSNSGGATTGQGGNSSAGGSGAATGGSTGSGGMVGGCHDAAPANAPQPPAPKAYSGGACPTLAPGLNPFTSSGDSRAFILVLPSDYTQDEKLPIIFLWHWLGGSADEFLQKGGVQAAADAYRFIAVIPEKSGNAQFTWPMDKISSNAAVEKDLTLFDDMLSCVAAQYNANTSCVSSAGVSAGALWTAAVVANQRSEYLSSFISLSGGTGGIAIKPWQTAAHKLPGLVLWGGPGDTCGNPPVQLKFEELSHDLESHLTSDGHFFVECVHNCGHSIPPLDDVSTISPVDAVWQFALDHPYWLPEGTSPYQNGTLPSAFPDWCGIGQGSATERVGACANGGGC